MDAIKGPLVSVITPVLNGIKYLEECIRSVLNQTYSNIEHVFIDGGSSDGTVEMLTEYRSKYPDRIRFISEPDRSAEEAWNIGLKAARGEILGWLGADDVYEPDTVTTVVEFFRKNQDAHFVFGECNIIDEKGAVIGRFLTKDFDLKKAINDACYIPCPSAFYKREVIEKVGLMDTSIHSCDLDYWIRVGKLFPINRVETRLSSFRMHRKSTSGARGAEKMYAREGLIICRRYGGSTFSARGRKYVMTLLIGPFRPILTPIYRFRPLRPVLVPIWHRIVGGEAPKK